MGKKLASLVLFMRKRGFVRNNSGKPQSSMIAKQPFCHLLLSFLSLCRETPTESHLLHNSFSAISCFFPEFRCGVVAALAGTLVKNMKRERFSLDDYHSTAVSAWTIASANACEADGPFAVIIRPSLTTGALVISAPPIFISLNDAGLSK